MQKLIEQAIANFWIRSFILVGYGAKGIIYLLIGILSIQAALFEGETAGTYKVLDTLIDQPLGEILLILLAVGLMGYVLRRLFQTLLKLAKGDGFQFKTLGVCMGYIMSGISYIGIALTALNLSRGMGEDDDMIEDLADQLFELPLGEWLIFLGGLAVVGVGIGYVYGAYSGSYIGELRSDLDDDIERWTLRIAKIGVGARGIAFVFMGIFVIQAAVFGSAEVAGGLEKVFANLLSQPLGFIWLGVIGLGFTAYGVYMLVAARYRRFAL